MVIAQTTNVVNQADIRQADLTVRRLLAEDACSLSPGLGTCMCCGLPWSVVEGHHTDYSPSEGCFPLCTLCWQMLTPDLRLPFYRHLIFDVWTDSEGKWPAIERAVLAGG